MFHFPLLFYSVAFPQSAPPVIPLKIGFPIPTHKRRADPVIAHPGLDLAAYNVIAVMNFDVMLKLEADRQRQDGEEHTIEI
jgi:hypothetical protein